VWGHEAMRERKERERGGGVESCVTRSGAGMFGLALCWFQVQWGTLLKARYNFYIEIMTY